MLESGYDITSAREQMLEQARDPIQFLHAATHNRVLLTHNESDFVLLHEAWVLWSHTWKIAPLHAGVIVLPQQEQWLPNRTVQEIESITSMTLPLENELWLWKPSMGWHTFDQHFSMP